MTQRVYGQYCGFARALELVGERWALMIVRDLLIGPRRFSDLQRGLPGIPTNILTARLKEMERSGLVERTVQPRESGGGVAYALTQAGKDLEPAVYSLGRWGAKRLGDPRPGETVTPDSLAMALRTTFQPAAAKGKTVSFELRFGEIVLRADVVKGKLAVAHGPSPRPDLIIETGPALRPLMAGEITAREALKSGGVRVSGPKPLLDEFVRLFRI